VENALADADTFFGIELPSLAEWSLAPEQAATIACPVLSVVGAETEPLWVEIAAFLRAELPHVYELCVEGAGHLLHLQRPDPVARGMADFMRAHPIEAAHSSTTSITS
jgi:pimeloyl-ACP methyl ester carboxylesterase